MINTFVCLVVVRSGPIMITTSSASWLDVGQANNLPATSEMTLNDTENGWHGSIKNRLWYSGEAKRRRDFHNRPDFTSIANIWSKHERLTGIKSVQTVTCVDMIFMCFHIRASYWYIYIYLTKQNCWNSQTGESNARCHTGNKQWSSRNQGPFSMYGWAKSQPLRYLT